MSPQLDHCFATFGSWRLYNQIAFLPYYIFFTGSMTVYRTDFPFILLVVSVSFKHRGQDRSGEALICVGCRCAATFSDFELNPQPCSSRIKQSKEDYLCIVDAGNRRWKSSVGKSSPKVTSNDDVYHHHKYSGSLLPSPSGRWVQPEEDGFH